MRGMEKMPAPAGTTQAIRLRLHDGRIRTCVIEVIDYHVNGFKRTRCLTHGRDGGTQLDKHDDKQTAIFAARDCYRFTQTPGFRASDIHPLNPILPKEAQS